MPDAKSINTIDMPSGSDAWALDFNITPKWVVPGWAGKSGTASPSSGNLFYSPIHVSVSTSYDYLGIKVQGAAAGGSLARLGIYEDDGGKPGDLLLDAGTVAIDSTGVKQIAISQTLLGYYWMAYVSDGQATLYYIDEESAAHAPGSGQYDSYVYRSYLSFYKTGQSGLVAAGLSDPATQPDQDIVGYGPFIMLREA